MQKGLPKKQKGIAVVEFAISVLVLLFVLLITAEVGRAFYSYNTLTKAVRAGARYVSSGTEDGSTGVTVISAAAELNTQRLVVHGNIAGTGSPVLPSFTIGNVEVDRTFPSTGAITYILVRATYDFEPVFSSVRVPGFEEVNLAFNMVATSTMRALK